MFFQVLQLLQCFLILTKFGTCNLCDKMCKKTGTDFRNFEVLKLFWHILEILHSDLVPAAAKLSSPIGLTSWSICIAFNVYIYLLARYPLTRRRAGVVYNLLEHICIICTK